MPLPRGFEGAPQRLMLGLEPREGWRDGRLRHAVRIDLEHPSWTPTPPSTPYHWPIDPGAPLPRVSRADTGRHTLLVHPRLDALPDDQRHVDLRLYDHQRRYVPRRLQVPLLPADQADAQEGAARAPGSLRSRQPVLFPGANHDLGDRATGLRGQVLRDGAPMRWARIEAQLPAGNVVGRAHGDDRGEFVLLLRPEAAVGALVDPLTLRVTIAGPAVAPVASDPGLPARDPFWDLPLERLPAPAIHPAVDPVAAGHVPPTGFVTSLVATRDVAFSLARITTTDPFVFS